MPVLRFFLPLCIITIIVIIIIIIISAALPLVLNGPLSSRRIIQIFSLLPPPTLSPIIFRLLLAESLQFSLIRHLILSSDVTAFSPSNYFLNFLASSSITYKSFLFAFSRSSLKIPALKYLARFISLISTFDLLCATSVFVHLADRNTNSRLNSVATEFRNSWRTLLWRINYQLNWPLTSPLHRRWFSNFVVLSDEVAKIYITARAERERERERDRRNRGRYCALEIPCFPINHVGTRSITWNSSVPAIFWRLPSVSSYGQCDRAAESKSLLKGGVSGVPFWKKRKKKGRKGKEERKSERKEKRRKEWPSDWKWYILGRVLLLFPAWFDTSIILLFEFEVLTRPGCSKDTYTRVYIRCFSTNQDWSIKNTRLRQAVLFYL